MVWLTATWVLVLIGQYATAVVTGYDTQNNCLAAASAYTSAVTTQTAKCIPGPPV